MIVEQDFPFPIYTAHLRWQERPNKPEFLELNRRSKKKFEIFSDLTIYPNESGRIMILAPGINESTEGFNKRYRSIANQMQAENFAATIVSPNPRLRQFLPTTTLKRAIDYSIDNAYIICHSTKPEILLMGFSAGASAVAALSSSDEKIRKILLIAPSGDMPKEAVETNLRKFTGEVYVVIGENDEVVGSRAGEIYYHLASSAIHKEIFIIPDCDHYFQSEVNDMIFKRAPFYAFAQGEKPNFFNIL